MTNQSAETVTGQVYVISAPSGAGKTSLVKALLQQVDDLTVSISHTTRKQRPGEVDGVDYHFVTTRQFLSMVEHHDFLEHAEVFDNFYGTATSSVDGLLQQKKDVILEIDWQGARQVRKRYPNAISIFILPPSKQALRERLTGRGQDDATIIERRMRDAVSESQHYHEADYLIINDDFEVALAELKQIISTFRMRTSWRSHLCADLLHNLLHE